MKIRIPSYLFVAITGHVFNSVSFPFREELLPLLEKNSVGSEEAEDRFVDLDLSNVAPEVTDALIKAFGEISAQMKIFATELTSQIAAAKSGATPSVFGPQQESAEVRVVLPAKPSFPSKVQPKKETVRVNLPPKPKL